MGFVYADTKITNISGGEKSYSMPFLVDTGSTDCVIPGDKLDEIGIKREYKENYELADGTEVTYDIGHAFISVNGKRVVGNVIFGPKDSEPLLGVTVLETAGFIVDPISRTLVKVKALKLK